MSPPIRKRRPRCARGPRQDHAGRPPCCGRPARLLRIKRWSSVCLDSNDQERERGITILAKAASIQWPRRDDQPRRHARARRLRRRGGAGARHGRRRTPSRRRRRRARCRRPATSSPRCSPPTCRRSWCSTRSTPRPDARSGRGPRRSRAPLHGPRHDLGSPRVRGGLGRRARGPRHEGPRRARTERRSHASLSTRFSTPHPGAGGRPAPVRHRHSSRTWTPREYLGRLAIGRGRERARRARATRWRCSKRNATMARRCCGDASRT